MAILYVLTVTTSNGVDGFPPSVMGSDWYASISSYWNANCLSKDWAENGKAVIIFSDQTALDAYITEHTLTDSSLLADVATWKFEHGVSYSTVYYTLTDAGITPTPTPVLS